MGNLSSKKDTENLIVVKNDSIKCRITLSKRDPNYKQILVITGFIRRYFGLNFPKDLINLCLSMSFMFIDQWNKRLSHYNCSIDIKRNMLESDAVRNGSFWRFCCGSLMVTKGMIAQWKFKIIASPSNIIIGIVDANNMPKIFSPREGRNSGCGYHGKNGNFIAKHGIDRFGQKWGGGSIITMTLDMRGIVKSDAGILSFHLNDKLQGEEQGNSMTFVNLSNTYRMMMSCKNDKVARIKIL